MLQLDRSGPGYLKNTCRVVLTAVIGLSLLSFSILGQARKDGCIGHCFVRLVAVQMVGRAVPPIGCHRMGVTHSQS